MNRRNVVEGLLLGAAIGATGLAAATPAPDRLNARRRIVVFDSRFAAARQFGVEAGQGAWLLRGIRADITPLWHELLDIQWQRHASAIHGMTTPRSCDCLQQLVADRFWRVTSRTPGPGLIKWALMPARRSA